MTNIDDKINLIKIIIDFIILAENNSSLTYERIADEELNN